MLRSDDDPVGRVEDRLVLLVPANAVVLVCVVAEQLYDLAAPRRAAVQLARLDPVAYMCAACRLCCQGDLIEPCACDAGIGVGR
jgi:hypothetical protein